MVLRKNKDIADRIVLIPYLCLLSAVVLEFLFFALEGRCGGVAYAYAERYLAFPAMGFLGASLCRELSPRAKRTLMLSAFMLGWFFLTQTIHQAVELDRKETGTFFFVYGMAFPFAAVMEDGQRQRGLKLVAGLFLTVSILVVAYAGLLTVGLLPPALEEWVYWDGSRFTAMGHPNISACLLMIGIGIGMGVCLKTKKPVLKGLLLALAVGQYITISLTNGRTTMVMTSLLLGGIVFTALRGPNWKRLLAALLAGVLAAALAFVASGWIYKANNDRLIRQYAQQAAVSAEEAPPADTQAADSQEETLYLNSEGVLVGSQGQGSWENDIHTLNGRTYIWRAALEGLKENSKVVLWGTEYVDLIVSRYNYFDVVHTHNSWLEAIYRLGLPGLAVALVLTLMAARDIVLLLWRGDDPWKSCIALLTACLLGCAMLEPYLFVADVSYHYLDFLFLFCLGCMNEWCAS